MSGQDELTSSLWLTATYMAAAESGLGGLLPSPSPSAPYEGRAVRPEHGWEVLLVQAMLTTCVWSPPGGGTCGPVSPLRMFTFPSQVRSKRLHPASCWRNPLDPNLPKVPPLVATPSLGLHLPGTPHRAVPLLLFPPSRTTKAPEDICGSSHLRRPQPGRAQVYHRDPPILCLQAEGHWSR